MPYTLPILSATRYAVPLREGGSLPAVMETEDDGLLYVVKMRGAGQGTRALVAELVIGLIARRLGLPVPALALIEVDAKLGRNEADPEIQALLRASHGINVGMRYLDGAFNYDPLAAADLIDPELAADIVWLDAFTTNVDRSPRNPNLMIWRRRPWLIDHGAALFVHQVWGGKGAESAVAPFTHIAEHVLLPIAGDLRAADERMAARLDEGVLRDVAAAVPDTLLLPERERAGAPFDNAEEVRAAILSFFAARLTAPRAFVDEAKRAYDALPERPDAGLSYRR
jgi:hypothetical protein